MWSSLSQRVHAKLGRPLPDYPPDAADPEFLTLLNLLRQADPDLAEEVISVYAGTSQRLPSEAEAAAERRRLRVHRRLFERFFRPDGLRTGRTRLNFRKTLNWIAVAVALVIVVWSLIPKSPGVSSSASPAASNTRQAVTNQTPVSPAPRLTSSPTPSSALSPDPPSARPARIRSLAPSLTAPPSGYPPPAPSIFIGSAARPSSVSISTAVPTQVIVYEASQLQQASFSPLVYQREEPEAGGQHGQVVVYDASAAHVSAGNPTGLPLADPGASAQATATRGQLLDARLATPVAVTPSGAATPALAEVARGPLEGALLLGQATRSPEGLVLIQFTALITNDGREQPFRGAAYDAGVGRMGVAGQASTMMPGAASALLAATMQATSDYFKARAQQQQVTITNGFLSITQGPPSFWDGLASAVARALAPNPQATTGPTVVTRLDRGQTIKVLVV